MIYWQLVKSKLHLILINLEDKARAVLIKREMELRLLIRQMEIDRISRGTLFQKLEKELHEVRQRLSTAL
jgi:hypothetical protein